MTFDRRGFLAAMTGAVACLTAPAAQAREVSLRTGEIFEFVVGEIEIKRLKLIYPEVNVNVAASLKDLRERGVPIKQGSMVQITDDLASFDLNSALRTRLSQGIRVEVETDDKWYSCSSNGSYHCVSK